MEQYSPIPEDGKHQPRKWQCSRRQMDQNPIGDRLDSIRLVSKVQRQDVEEIENQHHFTPEEMFLRKQDGPQERKHVEHSKVPAHMTCSIHSHGGVHVRDEDLHNKTDLQDIQQDPINKRDNNVGCKRGMVNVERTVVVKWRPPYQVTEVTIHR